MSPDDAILDEINRLADGKSPPTVREFRDDAEYSVYAVYQRWGSWNAALQEAGFTPNRKHNIADEEILNEINRLSDGGSPPTLKEFTEKSEYGANTAKRRWGSWNAALQQAGFTPNKNHNMSDEKLLISLREDAQGKIAPKKGDRITYGAQTYFRRFETWWKACIRAGLQPHSRRPLTHTDSRRFYEATVQQQNPRHQLIGLFAQFTGIPPKLLPKLSPDWISTTAENMIVRVPASETQSGDRWTFKFPDSWIDETGKQQETGLSGLLTWVLEQDGSIDFTGNSIQDIIYNIAQEAGLQNREHVHKDGIGNTPLVRHSDLRATGGVQMARNGAPTRRIRRHLGIEHTDWQADVEDFFLWLYVHESYEHPDYDPPDVVLDPV